VARPVNYALIGCARGERCVIERTENGFETREGETSAANDNDWGPSRPRREARIAAASVLTCSPEEAAAMPRPPRRARSPARAQFKERCRLGEAAGPEPLYAASGDDESRACGPARGRLRNDISRHSGTGNTNLRGIRSASLGSISGGHQLARPFARLPCKWMPAAVLPSGHGGSKIGSAAPRDLVRSRPAQPALRGLMSGARRWK